MSTPRVVLHPRVGGPRAVRVWIGILDHAGDLSDDDLSWKLDDAPAVVKPIRGLERTFGYDGIDFVGTITGVFELPCTPTTHVVEASVTKSAGFVSSQPLRTAPCPARLPPDGRSSFNVLLGSCFYQPVDKLGRVGAAVERLPASLRPHLTVLMGDQVYLDNPPTETFPDGKIGVTRRLEQKYLANWSFESGRSNGFARVLDAAPVTSVPDDHEYWNNYPMRPVFPAELLMDGGRDNWETSACRLYTSFQQDEANVFERDFDVSPLSFYLMDNRTFRASDLDHSLERQGANAIGLDRFRSWVARVSASHDLIPVLVTGPSVFQHRKEGAWWKFWTSPKSGASDANLSNFGDYKDIINGLSRLSDEGRPVLSLSGDVHYSRVLGARRGLLPGRVIHEVICSPTSLVPFLWKDDPKSAKWPKDMRLSVPGGNFTLDRLFPVAGDEPATGDSLAIASFRVTGYGVELSLTYVTIGDEGPPRTLSPVVVQLRRFPI